MDLDTPSASLATNTNYAPWFIPAMTPIHEAYSDMLRSSSYCRSERQCCNGQHTRLIYFCVAENGHIVVDWFGMMKLHCLSYGKLPLAKTSHLGGRMLNRGRAIWNPIDATLVLYPRNHIKCIKVGKKVVTSQHTPQYRPFASKTCLCGSGKWKANHVRKNTGKVRRIIQCCQTLRRSQDHPWNARSNFCGLSKNQFFTFVLISLNLWQRISLVKTAYLMSQLFYPLYNQDDGGTSFWSFEGISFHSSICTRTQIIGRISWVSRVLNSTSTSSNILLLDFTVRMLIEPSHRAIYILELS